MENDLISRSELIENFFKIETPYRPSQINEVLNLIKEQPTAYNIDKVVEQIREYFGTFLNKSIVDDICNIVKGGGVK